MVERMGHERFLADVGAKPLQSDDVGDLYRIELPDDEPIVLVGVVNSTPEPDGHSKRYLLRVPPTITSAREAVAWTFDVKPQHYRPALET